MATRLGSLSRTNEQCNNSRKSKVFLLMGLRVVCKFGCIYSNVHLPCRMSWKEPWHSSRGMPSCKYEMCSKELSQHPQLLLPCARAARLSSQLGPTSALTRNPLSSEEVKQFRKTANMIEQQPWAMHDGSNYLRGLCDRSERADFPTPAPLALYKIRQHEFGLEMLSGPREVEWSDFAPKRPKDIVVTHAKVDEKNKWMLSKKLKLLERKGFCSRPRPKLPKGSVTARWILLLLWFRLKPLQHHFRLSPLCHRRKPKERQKRRQNQRPKEERWQNQRPEQKRWQNQKQKPKRLQCHLLSLSMVARSVISRMAAKNVAISDLAIQRPGVAKAAQGTLSSESL